VFLGENMNSVNEAYQPTNIESQIQKTPHILGGVAITAGTAIGAGMFSLPIVSSSMGFGWSLVCMAMACYAMYHASMSILEVNLHFEPGESFYTMVKGILGKKWAIFNGILFAFLFYILNYAYISGGSAIVNKILVANIDVELSQGLASICFMLFAGFFVWLSTKAVDRILIVLITAMSLTFIMAISDLTLLAQYDNLMPKVGSNDSGYQYIFAALPFYLTSFGFHSNVPSLVKYYGKKPKVIAKTILFGALFCIVIYSFWLISTLGNLNSQNYSVISEGDGTIHSLVIALNQVTNNLHLSELLNYFANMAVLSSFLGVSLGLFDFLADKLKFPDDGFGRLKTAMCTFIPPALGSYFYPNGFIMAIGFAGLLLAINALIIPAFMVKKSRKMFSFSEYTHSGGSFRIHSIIILGIIFSVCHLLSMFGFLPNVHA